AISCATPMSPSSAGWRAARALRSASTRPRLPCARPTEIGRSSSTVSLSTLPVPMTRRRESTPRASGRRSVTGPCGPNCKAKTGPGYYCRNHVALGGGKKGNRAKRRTTNRRHLAPGAAAVLLRLDHPGLPVLLRLCPPGPGRCHSVDLRRTDDERVRLVAHGALWRGVAWRHLGRADLATDRPGPGSARRAPDAVRGGIADRAFDHAAVADPVDPRVLLAVLHCAHELCRTVRHRHLRRRQ